MTYASGPLVVPLDAWERTNTLSLEQAILCAVVYADIFDHALSIQEVHRYLVGRIATLAEIHEAIDCRACLVSTLAHHGDWLALAGREQLFDVRSQREKTALEAWPRALRYARIIGDLPFVRMVAVTGGLAMNNVTDDDDLDYLIVTDHERVWLARALIIAGAVRPAARRNDVVCPNYVVSSDSVLFSAQNLFVAHELAQMVPLVGLDVYHRVREVNAWTLRFLPNAKSMPSPARLLPSRSSWTRSVGQRLMNNWVGTAVDRWEMRRKIDQFCRAHPEQSEASFCADWCKGHFGGHGRGIRELFEARIQALNARL